MAPISNMEPAPENGSVLFLIGDAGEPQEGGEPVLEALTAAAKAAAEAHGAENVAVAFLGDFIYPNGLPLPGEKRRDEMLRKLEAQMQVARGSGVRAFFIPGNHDWWGNKGAGLDRLGAVQDHLRDHGGGLTQLAPADGCPGPAIFDIGAGLRLVALDTHWWLRSGPKPGPAECPDATDQAFHDSLTAALGDAGERRTVVAAHHPLISGGPHGGTTLFIRSWGVHPQDLPHRRYRALINRLDAAFETKAPTLFAGGHEHSLQLHRADGYAHAVVGGGNQDVITDVGAIDETVTCARAPGFARLTVGDSGATHLSLFAVNDDGSSREIFSGPPPS